MPKVAMFMVIISTEHVRYRICSWPNGVRYSTVRYRTVRYCRDLYVETCTYSIYTAGWASTVTAYYIIVYAITRQLFLTYMKNLNFALSIWHRRMSIDGIKNF
jgi:hypothetical protein